MKNKPNKRKPIKRKPVKPPKRKLSKRKPVKPTKRKLSKRKPAKPSRVKIQLPSKIEPPMPDAEAVASFTQGELKELLERDRFNRFNDRMKKRAIAAVSKYRVRKGRKAGFAIVGLKGRPIRGTQKGFLVYVDSKGNKTLIAQPGLKPYHAQRKKSLEAGFDKKGDALNRKKLLRKQDGNPVTVYPLKGKQSEILPIKGGRGYGRNVTDAIARGLVAASRVETRRRSFVVIMNVSVKLADGKLKTYSMHVPFSRAPLTDVDKAGVMEFIRRKLYAAFAQQLGYDGYVTTGSANHIRRIYADDEESFEGWQTMQTAPKSGVFRGDAEQVTVKTVEFKIVKA